MAFGENLQWVMGEECSLYESWLTGRKGQFPSGPDKGGTEGGRERGRERGREGGKEGGREGG